MALASEHGFAQELGRGTILRGWALILQGYTAEGLRQIGKGLAAYQATGAEAWRPYYLGLLAQAHAIEGQVAEGLRVLTEALDLAASRSDPWWEAELRRLMGELLLMRPVGRGRSRPAPTAVGPEACFHQALDVARRRHARSLELRAAMSLSRLWRRQGKRDAARTVLAEVYGWFTEGFDTADLHEAGTLLAELSNNPKEKAGIPP